MSGDREKAKFLQRALAYGMAGDTRHECLFILYGATTRNGKGTLMNSVLRVMGDYGATVRAESLAQKRQPNSQAPSEDIARLYRVRFANVSEPSRGLVLDDGPVKNMTGSDKLNARFLNENSIEFFPEFKVYINTNYLPVITDMAMFTSGRVVIIPFLRHFDEAEQDRGLKALFAEPETQSAILNWLLEGFRLYREDALRQPGTVKDAIAEYYHDSDKMRRFVEDMLIEDASAEVRTSEVYDAYRQWCADNGFHTENGRNFNADIRKYASVVRKRPQKGGEKTTLLLGYRVKSGFLSV